MSDTTPDEIDECEEASTGFEKLELANDHEERAEKLRSEAKRDVLDAVSDQLPFDANLSVSLIGDNFEVECIPNGARSDLEDEFDESIEIASPLKIRVGDFTNLGEQEWIKNLKQLIGEIESKHPDGAPVDRVLERAKDLGMDPSKTEHEIDKLKQKGEVYEPSTDCLRTT